MTMVVMMTVMMMTTMISTSATSRPFNKRKNTTGSGDDDDDDDDDDDEEYVPGGATKSKSKKKTTAADGATIASAKSPRTPKAKATKATKAANASSKPKSKAAKSAALLDQVKTIMGQPETHWRDAAATSRADLENAVVALVEFCKSSNISVLKPAEELEKDVNRLKSIIPRNISALMKWRPSCVTRNAKFSYECAMSPAVFECIFKQRSDRKMIRIKSQELFDALGQKIFGQARYDTLFMSDNVTLRFDAGRGSLIISGSYGK